MDPVKCPVSLIPKIRDLIDGNDDIRRDISPPDRYPLGLFFGLLPWHSLQPGSPGGQITLAGLPRNFPEIIFKNPGKLSEISGKKPGKFFKKPA
jgi:hypothetical protein